MPRPDKDAQEISDALCQNIAAKQKIIDILKQNIAEKEVIIQELCARLVKLNLENRELRRDFLN